MKTVFPILINYTQILVFLRDLDRPGLLWTDEHVAQGFAWDHGIVSFGVPDHDGECLLEVDTDGIPAELQTATALWAIEVPFEAAQSEVRIGTVLDDKPFVLSPGLHRLVFEAHPGLTKDDVNYTFLLRLTFMLSSAHTFSILKQGPLTSGTVLTTTAQRA